MLISSPATSPVQWQGSLGKQEDGHIAKEPPLVATLYRVTVWAELNVGSHMKMTSITFVSLLCILSVYPVGFSGVPVYSYLYSSANSGEGMAKLTNYS